MPARVFSVALVLTLVVTNLRGVTWFSAIQLVTAGAMILSIAAVGIIGLLGLGGGTPVESSLGSFNPLGWSVFSLVALGFWLFVGAEFVTTLAEEIKKPKVYIPLSMFLGLLIIFVAGGLYGLASLKYVTAKELASSRTPHVDLATALLGRIGQVWMSLASILASATTMNTVLCALPRMLYGMAKKGQLPSFLGKLNRFQVPSVATYLVALAILTPLVIGVATASTFVIYILASTFTWVIGYIIAHVDLIVLRIKRPEIRGGFRTPLFPVPQLLSLAALSGSYSISAPTLRSLAASTLSQSYSSAYRSFTPPCGYSSRRRKVCSRPLPSRTLLRTSTTTNPMPALQTQRRRRRQECSVLERDPHDRSVIRDTPRDARRDAPNGGVHRRRVHHRPVGALRVAFSARLSSRNAFVYARTRCRKF